MKLDTKNKYIARYIGTGFNITASIPVFSSIDIHKIGKHLE